MSNRLLLLAAMGLAGLGLVACEAEAPPASEPTAPPPVEQTAPAVEDAATDATADVPAQPAQQTAPPPSDTGDMGDARSSEESVQEDSETVFY